MWGVPTRVTPGMCYGRTHNRGLEGYLLLVVVVVLLPRRGVGSRTCS